MTRVPTTSVPRHRAPGAAQPSLNRRLRRWLAQELGRLRPEVAAAARRCEAERYRKHFDSFAHACLLLFHGLSGGPSLRQSYAAFAGCPGLVALSGLGAAADAAAERLGVSFSQFAASNRSRPAGFLGGLIPALAARVRWAGRGPGMPFPPDLALLDSTFLRLSLKLASWLPGGGGADVPGVRLQVRYAPALDLPEHVLLTDTRVNDCQGLDRAVLEDPAQLAALRGRTLVIDLGYYSHRRFARLLAAGVHLVSRLLAQAGVAVTAERPVQAPLPGLGAGRIVVLHDQEVTLGSPNNRAGAVLTGLRLVTARVAPRPAAARRGAGPIEYRLLTDRWDLAAAEVVQLYLWRWQIELFFRWLKSHVRLPRLLGYSRAAVELTVWLAVVVHLLTLLAARALGLTRRSPELLRRLLWALAHLEAADDQPAPAAQQLAFQAWWPPSPAPT
jgi:Transposase DDE domain